MQKLLDMKQESSYAFLEGVERGKGVEEYKCRSNGKMSETKRDCKSRTKRLLYKFFNIEPFNTTKIYNFHHVTRSLEMAYSF